jgi:hypothetical protein
LRKLGSHEVRLQQYGAEKIDPMKRHDRLSPGIAALPLEVM